MDAMQYSDTGHESDLDVIVEEDDLSDTNEGDMVSALAADQDGESGSGKKGDSDANTRKPSAEDEPSNPYLPRLKTSIIQLILGINAELIQLCQEYQNNGLMDDPQFLMYQMRLQSNLAYLASVADHYLDPTRCIPDLRPLPKPTLPECQGTSIAAKLAHAKEVYAAYVSAWSSQQMELSKKAKLKLRDEEKAQFANMDQEKMHQKFEQVLKKNRVIYEGSGDEPIAPESYVPFPPFRVPKDTQLPPGLQSWSFDNDTASPI
ncbi:hypothetical protein GGI15_003889 [Coemansia interrupta]|uniref:SS18 N-terminal domain-containing protein n=1 Tax=Coemansia interrupta TaxID=1126814 RepID=A0A9W8H7B7_9FUNG|nr:hypothetical protein GGI15_003889 [Coemansia interrupta]